MLVSVVIIKLELFATSTARIRNFYLTVCVCYLSLGICSRINRLLALCPTQECGRNILRNPDSSGCTVHNGAIFRRRYSRTDNPRVRINNRNRLNRIARIITELFENCLNNFIL